jgi:hypothetical protein
LGTKKPGNWFSKSVPRLAFFGCCTIRRLPVAYKVLILLDFLLFVYRTAAKRSPLLPEARKKPITSPRAIFTA